MREYKFNIGDKVRIDLKDIESYLPMYQELDGQVATVTGIKLGEGDSYDYYIDIHTLEGPEIWDEDELVKIEEVYNMKNIFETMCGIVGIDKIKRCVKDYEDYMSGKLEQCIGNNEDSIYPLDKEYMEYGANYELRNGDIYAYIREEEILKEIEDGTRLESCVLKLVNIFDGSEIYLSDYRDDLKHYSSRDLDIVKLL